MNKINWKAAGTILLAIFAGVATFSEEIDKKKQADDIKELKNEMAKLKEKES